MKLSSTDPLIAVLLIAIATTGRLVPHPDNFTPVLAVALFSGAVLRAPAAYGVPIAAMLASDLVLGHGLSAMTPVIYGSMAIATVIGRFLAEGRTWSRTVMAAMAGSILFYVITNFAVWASPGSTYDRTLGGLLECYAMAVPFFRNGLLGDLFWTTFLFATFGLRRTFRMAAR